MALGRLKRVNNLAPKWGSSESYWFVKVQSDYGSEEYWLVTDHERKRFSAKEFVDGRIGIFTLWEFYYTVPLKCDGKWESWWLTGADLERIRDRVEKNQEDIEANRESWLADLID